MQYKFLRNVYLTLSLILSHVCCIVVTHDWMSMKAPANSAPPSAALFNGIPFVIAILVLLLLAKYYHLKYKDYKKNNQ